MGFMYAPSQNFKTSHLAYRGGSQVTFGILLLYLRFSLLLSQFQAIYVSFVNVSVSKPCRLSEFYPDRASQLGMKPRDSLEVKPYGGPNWPHRTWKCAIKKLPEIAQLIPFKLRCRNIFSFF